MAAPATNDEFLDLIRKSGVADERRFDPWLQKIKSAGTLPAKPNETAALLVRDGLLTHFQAEQILQGKWRRFTIGKYKVLERLGSGGMGSVYLCEHKLMRRRVAVKVLPTAKAADEAALQRFYREARAVAALDHPNIVHAYDIDQDETLHFLVMEYVDGASLQEIIKKSGPMDIARACHYIRQSAFGLEHAHAASLIHRDIKPGNILVDRTGLVKILDMGLARFFNDEDDVLTKKFDENVLGTADYLAPEQAIDSHEVDIRADIYSLGATFYYMLTGRTPFGDGTVAQKLLWHQSRNPKPVTEYRPEVPAPLAAVIAKMMSKEKENRYQTPSEVAQALEPFTQSEIGPPPDIEMPRLSPAATGQPGTTETSTAVGKSATAPVPKALQGMASSKSNLTKQGPDTTRSTTPPPTPTQAPPKRPVTPAPPPRIAANAPTSPAPRPKPAASPPARKPNPAPAPAAQTVAAPEPPSVEEEAPWESLSSVDTEDPSAKGDTAPEGGKSARRLARSAAVKNMRRAWRIFAVIGVGGLMVVTGLIIYFIYFSESSNVGPPRRPPLDVMRDTSKPNSYRSILAALREAQAGDVIQLHDAEYTENLLVEYGKSGNTTDVTIQVAPGKEVVWKPYNKDDTKPILWLQGARNFKLNGDRLTFDGTLGNKKRVKNLILINFASPGLTIENATFKEFDRSAINVVNASGDKTRPMRFVNLMGLAGSGAQPEAGLLFDAGEKIDPPFNDYFSIADCRFEGVKDSIKKKDNTVVGSNIVWPK